MTLTERRQRAAERKARDARLEACRLGFEDERRRVHAAIAAGGRAVLDTAFGPYVLESVNADWWYTCQPANGRRDWATQRSFAGCNNGQWAEILRQLGLPRNAAFA